MINVTEKALMTAASKSSPVMLKTVFWTLCGCVVLMSFLSTLHKTGMVDLPGPKPSAYIYFPGKYALRAIFEDNTEYSDSYPGSNEAGAEDLKTNTSIHIDTKPVQGIPAMRKKVTHVGLLKVHKASSTTMQNMMFRFGLTNGLTIVTPRNGHYYYSEQHPTVKPPNFTHYDIFACHTIYSKSFYDKLLPSDAIRVGIIREPFDRMTSAAYYYRDVQKLRYLRQVPAYRFIHNLINKADKYDVGPFSRTRNSMGKDFGFPRQTKVNDTAFINSYLRQLGRDFKLVLITERFEESLVLMKRLLNWSFSDIIYLTSNANVHKETNLTAAEWGNFERTNFLDVAIYKYFLNIFNKKVKKGGKDLQAEVNYFKLILVQVKEFCDSSPKVDDKMMIKGSKWDVETGITGAECILMQTHELKFFSKLRTIYKSGKPISYYSFLET